MPHLAIDPKDPTPLYVQLISAVKRGIALGVWREGEPLPSVRQIAIEMQINPNTVLQAYRELEREGVTIVKRDHGTFVNSGMMRVARDEALDNLVKQIFSDANLFGIEIQEVVEALNAREPVVKRIEANVDQ